MKSQFLKIAGVKSEKAFYKKFPTEAAFFKAHPEAKKMVNGGEQDRGQLKKLQQLTDFGNPPIAQTGEIIPFAKSIGGKDIVSTLGGLSKSPSTLKAVDLTKGAGKGLGPASSYIGAAQDIIGGIGALKQEKKALKQAEQDAKLTNVMAQAAESRPKQPIKRQYVRPEDALVQPDQTFPTYGIGTNILAAEDGAVINQIGGNPTEIVNTFAPNTIYSDMGYEPLEDSSQIKSYYGGGKLTKAQLGGDFANKLAGSGFGQFMSNPQAGDLVTNIATRVGTGGKGPTGSSQLGKGIGTAAGTAFLGPVGGVIGGALGSLVGGLFGKKKAKQMAQYKEQTSGNINRITGQNVSQGIQDQYSSFMENGGQTSDYGWVSHTWQPQVIAKFGEHDLKDLLAPDPTMDTLRTGGHIRQNRMFDTDMFAMGGDLKVYRGEAEPMSINPYLPDGGETIMFRGPSHEDGGMPIEYGQSPVEVEGGEPAVKLRNGSTGDEDLVVFGNLIEPNSKRKFKNVVADIAKKEAKQNKLIDKSINQLDNLDVDTPFDQLKMSALQANLLGGNMKLKNYADEKMDLAAKQSAINETAEELGIEADALAKGKMKKAKLGAAIKKAQTGIQQSGSTFTYNGRTLDPKNPEDAIIIQQFRADVSRNEKDIDTLRARQNANPNAIAMTGNMDEVVVSAPNYLTFDEWLQEYSPEDLIPGVNEQQLFKQYQMHRYKYGIPDYAPIAPSVAPQTAIDKKETVNKKAKQKLPWMDIANQIIPQLRPTNAEELALQQILPELGTAGEVEEPVSAQKFQPQLLMAYDVVNPQDQINAITAQANIASRAAESNAAAQAMILGQAAELKSKAIGEAQRANTLAKLDVYNKNIQTLNDAQLKNLSILDQQQVRQAQAKSATRATKLAAQQSIANKYLQNKAEQKTLQAYENLYNYRFGDQGRAQNFNPLAQFNIPQVNSMTSEQLEALAKIKSVEEKKKAKEARNGSIVKAIKNL